MPGPSLPPPPPYSPSKDLYRFKRVSQSSKQQAIKPKPRVQPKKKKRASPTNLAIRNPSYLRDLIQPINEESDVASRSLTSTPRGKGKVVGRFVVYDESPIVEQMGRFTIISSPSPEKMPVNIPKKKQIVEKHDRYTITESPSPKSKTPSKSPNKKK
jgi:hypothetical protein